MKCLRFFCIAVICAFEPIAVYGVFADAPPPQELALKAIRYRLTNIKRGSVRIRVINEVHPAQQAEFQYDILFDEHKIRQTRRGRLLGKPQWGESTKLMITDKQYITDDMAGIPVQVGSANRYKVPREHFRVLNPQPLGMDLGGADMLHTAHVESLLNRADFPAPSIQSDQCDGLSAWRLDYRQQESNNYTRVWIVPSQGFGMVRAEASIEQNGGKIVQTLVSQLKSYPDGDVWYPSRVVKTLEENGKVVNRQVIIIEDAHFGRPIDEAEFTLAGLDLKPGREIVDSTSGLPWAKVWDGKEVVDPSGIQTAPSVPYRRPLLLWILAAGLALLAVSYFWRVYRHKRAAPPTRI